ncbi:MAG: PIN domain-containing protein [Acidobacteriia bacterium]|nr:PIN domain-containing protein [Terriglobia bacterium]
MKSLFAGYYRPTKEEFDELWKNCIFVFDTSVLLDLYRSTAKTRDVLLSILEKIKDRIWLPYQAAWEYQENRLDVIAEERELYSELRKALDGLAKSVQQKMHNHAVESAEKIKEELEAATKKIVAIIDQGASDHPDLIASDHIREKITELFDGRVGHKLDEKRLADIYKDGPRRYEQKIPPGYKDVEKGGTRQFGDLVIWNEILDHARSKKRAIIFITSDTKEDWWWKQGQFTVGPRPELVQELMALSEERFYMYNVERFLKEAEKNLDTKVGTGTVKKAAEEFKEIEQKRTLEAPLYDMTGIERSLLHQSELREGLTHLSSSQWSTVPMEDWVRAVQIATGRSLSQLESAYLARLIGTPGAVDATAAVVPSCWDIAKFWGTLFRQLESKGIVLSPISSPPNPTGSNFK